MPPAMVSVIIPTYAPAEYLGQAIDSVLRQSFADLEVVVVDDGSPGETEAIVRTFGDTRLTLVAHDRNRGPSAARNTGLRASRADLVAFLDADDYVHPDKIAAHVEVLARRPDIGLTYNGRFNLNYSRSTIAGIWRPIESCHLRDLVVDFPFAPSDLVVRRAWLDRVGAFDETLVDGSEDPDLHCRLALAGCRFAAVDQALTYRRFHSGRRFDVERRHRAAMEVFDAVLADPRCPAEARKARGHALGRHSLIWALQALAQGDTALGQRLVRMALDYDSTYALGRPTALVAALARYAIRDDSLSHDVLLDRMLNQLPPETAWGRRDYDWAVRDGFVRKALRAAVWNRTSDATRYFDRAAASGARVEARVIQGTAHTLLNVRHEYGTEAADDALARVCGGLRNLGDSRAARRLRACYSVNGAFRSHRDGQHRDVIAQVGRALVCDPGYAANRGVLSILARSLVPGLARTGGGHHVGDRNSR